MANQQIPDVRVRLSAEGVDEVVRAFQQVSAAAKKSGKDSASGFGALKSALGDLKSLLPAIGLAGAVVGMTEMVKHALESADAIGKLSEKTGVSTEILGALNVEATLADVNFEQLSKGLTKFNKTMGTLDEGGSAAAAAVRRLFGSATALNGLNTDQRLEKVVTALGHMDEGFKKTKAAQDFFGKAGADLIPLFNRVADEGFDKLIKRAEALGLALDEKTTKSAEAALDSLKLLKLEAEGVATQFAAGLAPGIQTAMESVSDSVSQDGTSGFKVLGDVAGKTIGGIVLLLTTLGGIVGGTFFSIAEIVRGAFDIIENKARDAFTSVKGLGSAAAQALKGDFDGAKATIRTMQTTLDESGKASEAQAKQHLTNIAAGWKQFGSDVADQFAKVYGDTAIPGTTKKKGAGGDDTDTKTMVETGKALLALQLQRLQNELALYKAYDSLNAARAKQQYTEGLTSLADYYDARKKSINANSDREIAELQKERDLLVRSPLDIKDDAKADVIQAKTLARRKEVEALDAKIALARVARSAALDANDAERFTAEQAVAQKTLEIQAQIKTAQGDTYGAAIDAINKMATDLAKLHIDPKLIEQIVQIQTADAALKELQREGQNAFASLSAAQAGLQNQVASGQLFPFEAVEKYNEKVLETLPSLRALAAAQRAAAVTPEQIIAAENFTNQVNALGIAADSSAVRMAQFKAAVESSLTADLTNFFTSGIQQATGFGDAMRMMALSVVDSLRQVAAQMLATLIVQKALKAASAFGFSDGGLVSDNSAVGVADGGMIVGPGTGTSDSIPARLSHGEFVVRAASVAQPGVLPLLAAINRGMGSPSLRSRGVPHFADGGVVSAGGGMGGSDMQAIQLHVGLEEGVILRHAESFMRSKTGQRIQVENLNKNQKAVTRALGK